VGNGYESRLSRNPLLLSLLPFFHIKLKLAESSFSSSGAISVTATDRPYTVQVLVDMDIKMNEKSYTIFTPLPTYLVKLTMYKFLILLYSLTRQVLLCKMQACRQPQVQVDRALCKLMDRYIEV